MKTIDLKDAIVGNQYKLVLKPNISTPAKGSDKSIYSNPTVIFDGQRGNNVLVSMKRGYTNLVLALQEYGVTWNLGTHE